MSRHFSIIALIGMLVASCDKPESRLAPIAHALSFAQHVDFAAAGVRVPSDGVEFELKPAQAAAVFAQIQQRVGSAVDLPGSPSFSHNAVFFREVLDPVIRRARTQHGHLRPFMVTVYEIANGSAFDRNRDVFFVASSHNPQRPNKAPEPTTTSVTSPACAGAAPAVVVAHL